MHAHYSSSLLPSLASNVLRRMALVSEIKTLIETIRYAQRKERILLDACGGGVAAKKTKM